jgi:hypothetical protein
MRNGHFDTVTRESSWAHKAAVTPRRHADFFYRLRDGHALSNKNSAAPIARVHVKM